MWLCFLTHPDKLNLFTDTCGTQSYQAYLDPSLGVPSSPSNCQWSIQWQKLFAVVAAAMAGWRVRVSCSTAPLYTFGQVNLAKRCWESIFWLRPDAIFKVLLVPVQYLAAIIHHFSDFKSLFSTTLFCRSGGGNNIPCTNDHFQAQIKICPCSSPT